MSGSKPEFRSPHRQRLLLCLGWGPNFAVRQCWRQSILHDIWKSTTGCILPVTHQFHLIPSDFVVIFFIVIFVVMFFIVIFVIRVFIIFVVVLLSLFFNFVDVIFSIFVNIFIPCFIIVFILSIYVSVFVTIFGQFYWVTRNVWELFRSIIFGINLQQFHQLGGGLFSRK
ncbi:hypothetical protein GQ607_007687 [Colletotrichum asianum]|uniref:Uncharacterized protein n=1 Tax=Colletotrichum asianum TaxID=702518 RepID=A0A8H3WA08_9PEZI|nr:hypothetical protein GQ607_007687 [Colletotrichum asianum]